MAMTAARFRRMALGLADASESAHMGHPDFRVNGRIFASLRADGHTGMVKLPPAEQARLVREQPAVFALESGAWGRAGYTRVMFSDADAEMVGEALTLAWQAALAAGPARRSGRRAAVPSPRKATRR
jgi:hypothetical protein